MSLVLQHCGKTKSRDRDKQILKEIYVGLENEVDEKISTLTFGVWIDGKGYLDSWQKEQRGGVLYAVTITYTIDYDDNGNADTGDGLSAYQQSTLDCSILSLPLEANPNYRTCWNYYLIGCGEYSTIKPSWWSDATDTFIYPASEEFKQYRWIKQLSEMPTEPDEQGQYWQVVKASGEYACRPQKLGVETWDCATYTITEIKEFGQRNAAGSAASKRLNKIVATPEYGDFGVTFTNCNWKIDSATVSYNGSKWIVTTTYTMSGPGGWDSDLYEYTY